MLRRSFLFPTLVLLAFVFAGSAAAAQEKTDRHTTGQEAAGKGFGFETGHVAGKDFVEGELIVGLKKGAGADKKVRTFEETVSSAGGRVKKEKEDRENPSVLAQFGSEEEAKSAADTFARRPDVAFVERNGYVSAPPEPSVPETKGKKGSTKSAADGDIGAQSVSSDPGTGYQWHHTVTRSTASLGALSTAPPTVAVLDSGVDYAHSDLPNVIVGRDFVNGDDDPMDDNGHGTHVAGIVAAKAGNSAHGEGVSPNSKILAIKVLAADLSGTFFDVAEGMTYARTTTTTPTTKVINMSLGGASNSTLISTEVDAIKAAGKVLVAAAGNDNSTAPTYPAADPDTALRVTATDENDSRAYFSNFSPSSTPSQYNIAAPGFQVYSTLPEEGFGASSGTSQAAPMVAGAAAVVWGQAPSLTRDQLVSRLVTNGKSISGSGFAASTKRVDVRKAVLLTTETGMVGRLLDPATGKAPNPNTTPANARLLSGTTQLATDTTNRSGSYEMTGLAAGTSRVLNGNRSGYVNATMRSGVNITSGLVVGPFTDALPVARPTGNATITVDWKTMQPINDTTGCADTCTGWDFDLLIKTPSGEYIDPAFDRGSLKVAPFVANPRDSADDLQPLEGAVVGSSASNGVYKVIVDKWPDSTSSQWNPSWSGSLASGQVYSGATPIGGLRVPPSTCGTNQYWHIGDLAKSGTSYTFTSRNVCTNTKP